MHPITGVVGGRPSPLLNATLLFGLCLIPGMIGGAFISAIISGDFRWVAPGGERVGAYLTGGFLMGVGAILAGGCNIGQGLTGMATLSLQSIIAVTGIIAGFSVVLAVMHRRAGR